MSQFFANNLQSLVNRTVTTLKPIKASDHESFRNDVELRITDLNSAVKAAQSSQTGSSAPNPMPRGGLYGDTSTSGQVKLYTTPSDTSGATDQVATRLRAQDISFVNGGGAAFLLGGSLSVNTTQVSLSGSTGDLQTYTIPANTISAQLFHAIATGTVGAANDANAAFGATTLNPPSKQFTNSTNYISKYWIVKTGAASQKIGCYARFDRDATGTALAVHNTIAAETLSANVIFKLRKIVSTGTTTGEILISKVA